MTMPASRIPSHPSGAGPFPARQSTLPHEAGAFLDNLVRQGLLDPCDRETFLAERIDRLHEYPTDEKLGLALFNAELLTPYQLQRLLVGASHGLVLGNYRVLEELGKGGMGVVYLAEHRLMKRRVAVKVLPVDEDCPPAVRQRFFGEMRVLAELSHPNVVLALDAGEMSGSGAAAPLMYLVTEVVEGGDLEKHVIKRGLCSVVEACSYIRQAAAGLQAAHDHHLVHRDLKPSNLLLTADGQVKLVDFGLARQFSSRLTDPRALLGSVEFMPPEQSHDPSAVGKEADIYGLGATLFWLLTGEGPYPHNNHVGQALRMLQQQPPRRMRSFRTDLPEALDDLVQQMLDRTPARRPASPTAVMNALRPFLVEGPAALLPASGPVSMARGGNPDLNAVPRVLIVDDELRRALAAPHAAGADGLRMHGCAQRPGAIEAASQTAFDLVLLDLNLPDGDGFAVCRQLRERNDNPTLKVIVVSGAIDQERPADALPQGADDYVAKPYSQQQLLTKVRHALELKAAQDRCARLAEQLVHLNHQLELNLKARNADLREAHDALLYALSRIAESRDGETTGHLKRLQGYTRMLALEAAKTAPWQGLVDERFLEQLERCVPLHDIGKIGLPDEILLKPASLSRQERETMETHAVIGDRLLESLGKEYGAALEFLGTARVIVRSHHERWDGKGYPDKLAGEAIPPVARLVAVADVYDALRRMRMFKPPMSHPSAIRMMIERSEGQFDPSLMRRLARCHGEFERIYRAIEE